MNAKQCNRCDLTKRLAEFSRHPNTSDGYLGQCKACLSRAQKERRLIPKHRAVASWHDMNKRVRKQSEYAGVLVLVTREAFISWATEKFTAWMIENPGVTPSIGRENPAGHYELSNMMVISWGENARLRRNNHNVYAPAGQAWCGTCKGYKPSSEFGSNRTQAHGLQGRCKKCRAERLERSTNPNWKNHEAPEGTLWCGKCESFVLVDLFYSCRTTKTGKQTSCKACQNSRGRRVEEG